MVRKIFYSLNIALFSATLVFAQDLGSRLVLPEGDFDRGLKAFTDLECHQCHTVPGVLLPVYSGKSPVTLSIGAFTMSVTTYPGLVTSIINPNHVISSRYLAKLGLDERGNISTLMPFKEQMTVRQLLDLVTFLDVQYNWGVEDYQAYKNYFDVLP
jgi:hypothetical protein